MATKLELSRAAIVDRAMQIADLEGIPAITIRRLAQDLGVTPMALYWHVKNKDELLDAMGDRLYESVQLDTALSGAPWHEQLRDAVLALVGAFRQHPTCLELVYRRIFASVDGRRVTEHTLGVLRRAGFTPRQTADIATHALQTAIMLVGAEPGAEVGESADELAELLDAKRLALQALPVSEFPYIREMADDLLHCDDLGAYYVFGVDLFVAGARATLDAVSVSPARRVLV